MPIKKKLSFCLVFTKRRVSLQSNNTKNSNDMTATNEKFQLADQLACEHINYLCRLSGKFPKNLEKARANFRESNLKFSIEVLKAKIENTKNAFQHPA